MANNMVVGVCTVELMVFDSDSLKDKRRVVRSAIQRMRRRFNVSAAEVDSLDAWNVATLAVVCVSNDAAHAQAVLNKVVDWLSQERLDAALGNVSIEIW